MCQSSLHVKFCACLGDKPLDYPRWELWRPEPETWDLQAVGSFTPPALEAELLADRVLQDLNRADAFDTDLVFCAGDKLVIHWSENDALMFRYDDRKWSSSLAWGMGGLNSKRPVKIGYLKSRWR